jgi:hypothetical protein
VCKVGKGGRDLRNIIREHQNSIIRIMPHAQLTFMHTNSQLDLVFVFVQDGYVSAGHISFLSEAEEARSFRKR